MRAGDLVRAMRVHDPLDPIRGWEIQTAEVLFIAPGYVRVRFVEDGAERSESITNLMPLQRAG